MLLVTGADRIVTMDADRRVLTGAAVAIDAGRIVAVDAEAALIAAHPDAERFDARGGWVIPGLVDAHQHLTGDRLARASIPDDLPMGDSIFTWAVPLHAAHTPDDDELAATLAAIEAVRHGVTFLVEAGTVAHPERVVEAVERVGLRATIGRWGWDTEGAPYAAPADEVIDRASDLLDRFPPTTDGLVEGWVTLVGHDLMSDELVVGATALARERGARMTYHLSPSDRDAVAYLARTGRRPVAHLDHLGVLGPHLLLAHAVHLDDDEVERVLRTRTAVANCPWAYLRLGQGTTRAGRHLELCERGGRVALGCDSENAGDLIDVLRAAALFAGLAKDMTIDPTKPGAHLALELATTRGAEAVGRPDLGSIAVGQRADLVVLDTTGPEWSPPGDDVALQIVWGTDGRAVRDVIVAGEVVVHDRRCTKVDEDALQAVAAERGADLRRRAGITPTSKWPVSPA